MVKGDIIFHHYFLLKLEHHCQNPKKAAMSKTKKRKVFHLLSSLCRITWTQRNTGSDGTVYETGTSEANCSEAFQGEEFQGIYGAGKLLEQSAVDLKYAGKDRLGKEDKAKEFRRKTILSGVYT